MSKEATQELFDGYFNGKSKILEYFGAEGTAHWDYDIDQIDDEWAICRGQCVWGPGTEHDGTPIPLSEDDCTYSSPITEGVFRGDDFTLVFMDLQMGGSGAATIFDNSKEQTPVEV